MRLLPLAASILSFFLVLRSGRAQAPAFFVFGDSLTDPGNNKFLVTTAQAAFRPNGIDFPGGKATGRFCNGFTVVDLIAQELGLPLVPAYHDPNTKGSVILKGVSYASGGARILNDSSVNFLQNIQPLGKQIQNFVNTRSEIVLLVGGEDPAFDLLSRSIFLFALGSNDYLNYMNSTRSKSPQEFQDQVISAYKGYLNVTYQLGARKIVVFALGPLGCIPFKREGNILGANGKACHEEANTLAVNFDRALKDMVSGMNRDLNGAKMVFGTTYDLFYDATNNPSKYGFVNGRDACCGVSPLRLFACLPLGSVCSTRNQYFYWDAYHPTESANRLIASAILSGNKTIMFPFNLKQLIDL
ncbi:hypothetical protein SELMODRAFT_85364 [Selaginella moellendorffii]|uniref:Uncharacterized protein n=1 Tax=Selaginella moellendorffii TaxID=88036 RepID=D8R5R7_SELML|nr:hypothetical protein SELMODRAFT_85364 [Selaginella moellendorffii]